MRLPTAGLACLGVTLAAAASLRSGERPVSVTGPTLGLGGPYNASVALQYVYLASAANCNVSAIEAWNCPPCRAFAGDVAEARVVTNATLDLQVIVGHLRSGPSFVSFRGTVPSSLQDWIDDLESAVQTEYTRAGCSGCHVADGFYESYLGLQPGIYAALEAFNPDKSQPVLVTGHSLGAAMSALCAFDLKVNGYNVPELYNFGQPRVGAPDYQAVFAQTMGVTGVYRLIHNADIVPHLPPKFLGFEHIPTEVWYNEDQTSYKICNSSGEDPTCSDSILLPLSVSDHENYLGYAPSKSC